MKEKQRQFLANEVGCSELKQTWNHGGIEFFRNQEVDNSNCLQGNTLTQAGDGGARCHGKSLQLEGVLLRDASDKEDVSVPPDTLLSFLTVTCS